MTALNLNLVLLQYHSVPGFIGDNWNKLANYYTGAIAKQPSLDLMVAGELAVSGYTPLDELYKAEYLKQLQRAITSLAKLTKNQKTALIFSDAYLDNDEKLYNAAYFLQNGAIAKVIKKQKLVDNDIFNETRYFNQGKAVNNFIELNGFKLAVVVCEDLWHQEVVNNLVDNDLNGVISLNASPYYKNKLQKRLEVANYAAKILKVPVLYVNIVGGVDGVVFDGQSFALSKKQQIVTKLALAQEELAMVSLNKKSEIVINNNIPVNNSTGAINILLHENNQTINEIDTNKLISSSNLNNNGSCSAKVSFLPANKINSSQAIINNNKLMDNNNTVASNKAISSKANNKAATLMVSNNSFTTNNKIEHDPKIVTNLAMPANLAQEFYTIIQRGFKDFMVDNGLKGVIIGVSGGIDSALSATIAVDTLGSDKVIAVSMPSLYTSDLSKSIIKELVANLGIKFYEIPINNIFNSYKANNAFKQALLNNDNQLMQENLQARIRGTTLMALSNNYKGYVVLCNGNKSELATGYFTLYGDSCGAFNLIKDLFKTEVFTISKWRNQNYTSLSKLKKLKLIPEACITRPPTAELSYNQTDEAALLPYALLDAILQQIIEYNLSYQELIIKFSKKDVDLVLHLLKAAEYKRKQGVVGIKLKNKGFGKEWQYPITNGFKQ